MKATSGENRTHRSRVKWVQGMSHWPSKLIGPRDKVPNMWCGRLCELETLRLAECAGGAQVRSVQGPG